MDVFKAWPGRAESIVISQESYMGCTGGVAPWRRDGDTGPSYYAVCPLCDNPIQIVGLFRRQEESRARRPYGRHHRGDVPGLCRYDEDAYLHCPYADPNHRTDTRAKRHPKYPTGRALYGLMRGEFDRVTLAWERFSGIHLGPGFLALDFLLHDRRIEQDDQHLSETFRLRGLLERDGGRPAFDDTTLAVDQDCLPHTADVRPGRDGRLLDIARETLQADVGILVKR